MPKVISACFLALIPKNDNPQYLDEYQLICLIWCIYKILSISVSIWSEDFDEVFVVIELVDLTKRRKEECMLFKVTFENAYNSVSWGFLDIMMSQMNFDAT